MQYCQNPWPRAKREVMDLMTRLYNMNVMKNPLNVGMLMHPTVVFCNNLSDTSLASYIKTYLISNFISNCVIDHVFFRVFQKPYDI